MSLSIGYVLTYDSSVSASAVPELIVQSVDRELFPGIRDEYVEAPGYAGSLFFGESDGDRHISMDCIIKGDNNASRRAAIRKLAKWAYKPTPRRLTISDEPDRFWLAKIDENSALSEKVLLGKFSLTWRTAPWAESLAVSEYTAVIPNGGGSVTVPVTGTDRSVDPVIELTLNQASGAGFFMYVGGVLLNYSAPISIGNQKTVSCQSVTVVTGLHGDQEVNTGGFSGATLDMVNITGGFGDLGGPAGNVITVSRGCNIRVLWRNRFL